MKVMDSVLELLVGIIPYGICNMPTLQVVYVTNGPSNPGITCAPACVSSVPSTAVPTALCSYPSNQESGLCGLVAATNINTLSGYSMWACTASGYAASTPCNSPVWNGIGCIGGNVVYISVSSVGLTGIVHNCKFRSFVQFSK